MKSGKANKLTSEVATKSLFNIADDLSTTLPLLRNMLNILEPRQSDSKDFDLPVAFATNALYSLERNEAGGSSLRDTYERFLLPILRNKAEYLHAEGVSQAVWALAHAELVEDKELWAKFASLVLSKDFSPVFVKNDRWSATYFSTHSNAEHFFQSELNEFAD